MPGANRSKCLLSVCRPSLVFFMVLKWVLSVLYFVAKMYGWQCHWNWTAFLFSSSEWKKKQTLSRHLYISIFGMASLMRLTPFHAIEILEILKKSLLSDRALLRTENYLALKQITICCPKFIRRSVCWLHVYVHCCSCRSVCVLFRSLALSIAPTPTTPSRQSKEHSLMFIVNNKTTLRSIVSVFDTNL